jgi:phosphoribosylformylglycinamidine (FGAM) synthase PurS component
VKRRVAVRLKVPDNTAYTTLVALRRLGIAVANVERARLVAVEGESEEAMLRRVESDEELFNVNLHEARVLQCDTPSAGEVDVAPRDAPSSVWRWRLLDERGLPLDAAALRRACEGLLCNDAIEDAAFPV